MAEIDTVTYTKASEATRALIEAGYTFQQSSEPVTKLPGVTTITYPWSKGSYLSARVVRKGAQRYRIEIVA